MLPLPDAADHRWAAVLGRFRSLQLCTVVAIATLVATQACGAPPTPAAPVSAPVVTTSAAPGLSVRCGGRACAGDVVVHCFDPQGRLIGAWFVNGRVVAGGQQVPDGSLAFQSSGAFAGGTATVNARVVDLPVEGGTLHLTNVPFTMPAASCGPEGYPARLVGGRFETVVNWPTTCGSEGVTWEGLAPGTWRVAANSMRDFGWGATAAVSFGRGESAAIPWPSPISSTIKVAALGLVAGDAVVVRRPNSVSIYAVGYQGDPVDKLSLPVDTTAVAAFTSAGLCFWAFLPTELDCKPQLDVTVPADLQGQGIGSWERGR